MAYKTDIRKKATLLRKKGYSLKEIAELFYISKSTASIWLRNITVSNNGQKRLLERQIMGQYKARLIKLKKGKIASQIRFENAKEMLSTLEISSDFMKLCCALLFWCEGNKTESQVRFTSSDPSLIGLFLFTLRKGFLIDEKKLRVLMHLHEYHVETMQRIFWSKLTNIKPEQFQKTYLKPHTGKRKHLDYPGCVAIAYYDANVAKELKAIYNAFVQRGVV